MFELSIGEEARHAPSMSGFPHYFTKLTESLLVNIIDEIGARGIDPNEFSQVLLSHFNNCQQSGLEVTYFKNGTEEALKLEYDNKHKLVAVYPCAAFSDDDKSVIKKR